MGAHTATPDRPAAWLRMRPTRCGVATDSPVAQVLPALVPPSAVNRGLRWLGHQRWLRYGLRNRVLHWLRNPQTMPDERFEVPFVGFTYPGTMSRWIDWIVYFYGAYELDELELMRNLMAAHPNAVALDIGANVGHHALYLASFCSAVHAFEPYDAVAGRMDEKIRRNSLQHIHVHRIGLGERDETLEFFAPQGMNTGTGTFVAGHEAHNNRPAGRLQLVHADRYLENLNLPTIDLIKIDVEGFELSTLRGLQATLRRYRPVVMLELSDAARFSLPDREALMAFFPPDYEAQVVRGQRHRFGLVGQRGCAVEALRWHHAPLPGAYMNLLLRPADAESHPKESR